MVQIKFDGTLKGDLRISREGSIIKDKQVKLIMATLKKLKEGTNNKVEISTLQSLK